jgi:hypothetical protein
MFRTFLSNRLGFNYKIGMGIGRQVDRRKVLTENRLNRIFFVLFVVIVISKREQNFSFQKLFFNLIFEKGEVTSG